MTVELLGLLIRHFNGEKYFNDIFMAFWVNAFLCQSKNETFKKKSVEYILFMLKLFHCKCILKYFS